MFKVLFITLTALIFFGFILLFYYAKTGYKIDQEVFKSTKKARMPKPVKLYAILLLLWIALFSGHFFIQLFF